MVEEANAKLNAFWCPERPLTQSEFDISRYEGTWYEMMRDKDNYAEAEMKCVINDVLSEEYK
jgi:lipocalin